MLLKEAEWISNYLKSNAGGSAQRILNIGSSTAAFRQEKQPFIHDLIFAPLEARGATVWHVDIKDAPGVDIVADVSDEADLRRLEALNADCVFCFNLLEHLTDPAAFCARLERLAAPGCAFMVSVPRSYPYHRDPIDTMFRPTPQEIAALFAHCALTDGAVVPSGGYRDKIAAKPKLILNHVFWFLTPFLGVRKWARAVAKLKWLFVDYKVSIAVLTRR